MIQFNCVCLKTTQQCLSKNHVSVDKCTCITSIKDCTSVEHLCLCKRHPSNVSICKSFNHFCVCGGDEKKSCRQHRNCLCEYKKHCDVHASCVCHEEGSFNCKSAVHKCTCEIILQGKNDERFYNKCIAQERDHLHICTCLKMNNCLKCKLQN